MPLSFKEVAEIMKIVDSSSCEELVLEAEGMRLVVRRGAGGADSVQAAPSVASSQPTSANTPAAPAGSQTAAAAPAPEAPPADEGTHTEKAPMVGTFYRRPSPEEAPFVEVGSKVAPGDTLCMIEVMKLYTTITASVGGVVEAILADDSALVEFDQPLFVIRSS